MPRALPLLSLLLALVAGTRGTYVNPWGGTGNSEIDQIINFANTAQGVLSQSPNYTAAFDGPYAVKVAESEIGSLTTLSGPPGIQFSFALLKIGACSAIAPHIHAIGNEIEFTLKGEKLMGGLQKLGSDVMDSKPIPPGTISIYPQGLNHVQYNMGCDPAELYVFFDSATPTGLTTITNYWLSEPDELAIPTMTSIGINITAAELAEARATQKQSKGPIFFKLPKEACSCP